MNIERIVGRAVSLMAASIVSSGVYAQDKASGYTGFPAKKGYPIIHYSADFTGDNLPDDVLGNFDPQKENTLVLRLVYGNSFGANGIGKVTADPNVTPILKLVTMIMMETWI